MLYLGYQNHQTFAAEIVAVDEFGEVLWSAPHSGSITAIAGIPGGGAIVGTDLGLTRLEADGTTAWTVPSISAMRIEVAPNGSILVGGHELAQLDDTKLILYSDEGEPIETIDVMGSSSRLWDLHFLDERRFYASGTEFGEDSFDGSALAVDGDGSVYVSMRHVMTSGFYLRKYLP